MLTIPLAPTRRQSPATDTLLACELCSQPAPLLYDCATPWLVAAVCPVCEPAIRGCAA